jgi:hypothetical protein
MKACPQPRRLWETEELIFSFFRCCAKASTDATRGSRPFHWPAASRHAPHNTPATQFIAPRHIAARNYGHYSRQYRSDMQLSLSLVHPLCRTKFLLTFNVGLAQCRAVALRLDIDARANYA